MRNGDWNCISDGPGHLKGYGNTYKVEQSDENRVASMTRESDGYLTVMTRGGARHRLWHHDDPLSLDSGSRAYFVQPHNPSGVRLMVTDGGRARDSYLLATEADRVPCSRPKDQSWIAYVSLALLGLGLVVAMVVTNSQPGDAPLTFALTLLAFTPPALYTLAQSNSKEFHGVPNWVNWIIWAYLAFAAMWLIQVLLGDPTYDNERSPYEEGDCDMFGCS